jgi:energy-coupling factor transporter transmembrane protein EcfT
MMVWIIYMILALVFLWLAIKVVKKVLKFVFISIFVFVGVLFLLSMLINFEIDKLDADLGSMRLEYGSYGSVVEVEEGMSLLSINKTFILDFNETLKLGDNILTPKQAIIELEKGDVTNNTLMLESLKTKLDAQILLDKKLEKSYQFVPKRGFEKVVRKMPNLLIKIFKLTR